MQYVTRVPPHICMLYSMQASSALGTGLALPKLDRPWHLNGNCRMAVSGTGNLDMLDCMLKGLDDLTYVHKCAGLWYRAGVTSGCCQTATLG